jgi:hypothetical protein
MAHGYIAGIGHVDGREFSGPIEPGQLVCVAVVGLDAVTGFAGNFGFGGIWGHIGGDMGSHLDK